MIFEHQSYRTFLKSELADRVTANEAYSLRAFSKHLGVTPSMLSDVLRGKRNLSLDMALKISHRLKLEGKEVEYFSTLVQFDTAKTMELKAELQTRLLALNSKNDPHDLNVDAFKMIADWYHIAILEICTLPRVKVTPAFIEECFNKVVHLSNKSKNNDAIYHLGIQYFRLNKTRKDLV